MKKYFRVSALTAFLFGISSSSFASGFQLWEQTAYGTGDYHAGAAAEGDDASLEFYNAAQITRLKHQEISVGGVIIPVSVNYQGTVTALGTGTVSTPPGGVNSSTTSFVPNIHYVAPMLNDRLFFSFGVTTPFGLETNYPSTYTDSVSLAATETKLMTINLNPALAFKISPHFSLGAGLDSMYGSAIYNNYINAATIDEFTNNLSGWGWGFNLGALISFDPGTRVGVSYRSAISINSKGKSNWKGGPNTTHMQANLALPSTTIVSLFHDFSSKWSAMASAFYTTWNSFSNLTLENIAFSIPAFNDTLIVSENYRNTWNFAAGVHYNVLKNLTLKLGGGYDQTPTVSGYRDIRLPDVNRYALAMGMHWQALTSLGLELGYTHLFAPKVNVDNTNSTHATPSGELIPEQVGTAKVAANVVGAQLSWAF